jgi:dihydroceramidase
MDGFWTGMAAPALVDWCEPNYAVTPYVAEFWNTVSSGYIAVLGVFGAWVGRRVGLEARFVRSFWVLAVVGLGSVAFHGTLLRVPQALDELPMVYLGLLACWAVVYRSQEAADGARTGWMMAAYAGAFTIAYWLAEEAFALFLATYSLAVAFIAIRSMYLSWFTAAPARLAGLLLMAALGFLGTLTFFWIPEHLVLECDHPAQALQLHSLWHLGSGTGTYVWIIWAICDRERAKGRAPVADAAVWPGWADTLAVRMGGIFPKVDG